MTAHILVVEDDKDLLSALSEVLDYLGYQVASCLNGTCALKMLDRQRYDLVICDHHLRDVEGSVVYKKVRLQAREKDFTPFLVFTGDGKRILDAYPDLAADYFVSKSVTMEELDRHIQLALNGNRA